MPKPKFFPHIHYPPDLIATHVEGLVIAHFKIDKHGHPADEILDFDAASKPFSRSVKDLLRSLLFDVPKDWNAPSSPTFDMTIEFVICPHKSLDGAVTAGDTIVVTGCTFNQLPQG